MDYTETRLWRNAFLNGELSADALKFRDTLRGLYEQFRLQVKPLASDIALSVPNYTDHSIAHCDALWDTASLLTSDEFPLNPAEAFVLGGSFLIHDLGMGIQAYSDGLREIHESVEWRDVLSSTYPDEWKVLLDRMGRDIAETGNWSSLSDVKTKNALTLYLRIRHAERAEEIVKQQWVLTNGETFYLIADNRLRLWYGEAIGKLGHSHWVDVDQLPEMFPTPLGAPPGYHSDWSVDMLKLACILRLADAIQIDARRADPMHTPHRNPEGISADHWKFQERMLYPQTINGRLVYTAGAAIPYKDAEAWWLAFDTAKMIDGELRKVNALCGDLGRPGFTASAVAGAESPDRFASFVPTIGWRPVDARPKISSSGSVITSLGGKSLYGDGANDRRIPIRELLANGLDATRARRGALGPDGLRPVQISLASDSDGDWLSVRDYGIGMTENDAVNNLCDFGHSGWRSADLARQFPGLLSSGFSPTGQYGIGFFSVFMIAENVTVVTRSVEDSWNDTTVVEFRGGPAGRPILRRATGTERLSEPGTLVRCLMSHRFTDDKGLFRSVSNKSLRDPLWFSWLVRSFALLADEDISVSTVDHGEFALAVAAGEWKTAPAEEIFDALNFVGRPDVPAEAREFARSKFAATLTPVFDSNREMIGRLGLDIYDPDESEEVGRFYFETFGAFCGGLRADSGYEYAGVALGKPLRASRDKARVDVKLEDMQRWFDEQISNIDWQSVSSRKALRIQNAGLALGIRSEHLPLALGPNGFLNPKEVEEYLSSRDSILVSNSFLDKLSIGDAAYIGITEGDGSFCLPCDGHLFVQYSFTYLDDDEPMFPVRQDEYKADWKEFDAPIGFHPITYWRTQFAGPFFEVVRIAASAWNVDTKEVILGIESLEHGETDRRTHVPRVGGGTARTEAYSISRPA